MQHKNPVNPITRHKKFSTVMKALHSVRGDRSQFERKGQMRNNSLHSTAQSNNNKTKTETGHPFLKKKNNLSILSISLFLVTKILLDRIVKPPLYDRKITLCMCCS